MTVQFQYNNNIYSNAVRLAQDIPLLTSVLVGWYDGAELLCGNAGAMCYDTDIKNVKDLKGIIKHCRDSRHNTVIEHGSATFVKKVPIFVARQDLRARHASFDERSLRYCRANDGSLTYYIPDYLDKDYIDNNFSGGDWAFLNRIREDWIEQHERAIDFYSKYTDDELNERFNILSIDFGRVKETMRAVLPVGINTMYMDTRNLWSWYHHSAKRLCYRAQKEIRVIREQEVEQLANKFPIIFGDVDRPCVMDRCPEKKPCGKVKLDSKKHAIA